MKPVGGSIEKPQAGTAELYRPLLEAMGEPVLVVDRNGTILCAAGLLGNREPKNSRLEAWFDLVNGIPETGEADATWRENGEVVQLAIRRLPGQDDHRLVRVRRPYVDAFRTASDLLFEHTSAATILIDSNAMVRLANRAFCQWSGYRREEVENRMSIAPFIHPADLPDVQDRVRRRFGGEAIEGDWDLRGVTRDGSEEQIRVRALQIPGSDFIIYSMLDVGEEKKRQAAEARSHTLLENCGAAILVMEPDLTISYANHNCEVLLGYSPEELTDGRDVMSLLNPASVARARVRMQQRLSGDPAYVPFVEMTAVSKSGQPVEVATYYNPIPDTEQLLISFIDISLRKKTELELEKRLRREELLSQVTSRLMDIHVENQGPRLQAALELIRLNFQVDRVTLVALPPGEGDGPGLRQFSRGDAPSVLEGWIGNTPTWSILREGEVAVHLVEGDAPVPGLGPLQMRMREQGCRVFYALPHRGREEEYMLLLESATRHDWSNPDFVILDTLVVVLANVLERVNSEQRNQVIQRQMWQSHKLDSIGVLAGGIAHDFNNMLAAILGNAELAMDMQDDPESARACLEDLLHAGSRAREMVQQILAFSRQDEVAAHPVSLLQVCEEALKMLRSSIPATIEIESDLQAAGGMVSGESTQLLQVLMNLCTNAYQAMGAHGLLQIGLYRARADEVSATGAEYLKLVVADSGPGVPEDLVTRIFDPFFTTKKMGEGTGMGLSVVHGIVHAAGGSITVQNRPEGGARFSVYLPCAEEAEPEPRLPDRNSASGEQERVLVVDDDPAVLRLMSSMLKTLSYRVEAFSDGWEAYEHFRTEPNAFDLVVTDITMPRLTGIELAQLLKAQRPELPVLACSGYSQNGIDGESIDGFVQKPFSRAVLSKAIRDLLTATA